MHDITSSGPSQRPGADETPHDYRELIDQLLLEKYEPVAIVGVGLRFPGDSLDLAGFANLLRSGSSGIGPIPPDRWDNEALHSVDPGVAGKIRTEAGGYIAAIDQFDARFFNISPKEAEYVDPQQRLMLETAWRALESANLDPFALRGANGGVYVGVGTLDYAQEADALAPDELDGYVGTGMALSVVSGRLSYFLGWQGPSLSVDAACSSSLTALHLATVGLRRRECDIALCGGVNVISHPRGHIVLSQANMLAPDGRCKTFDERADGYGRSEGCAVLVLKRLSDAKRDADHILALVRGSAVRHSGASGGLTVPNGIAQQAVMRQALANAMLRPSDVQYVEAHGTGTSLGDPIEMGAIHAVFGDSGERSNPVLVGSVKTNIGHMEAAAGVGGVAKTILQLQDDVIYPHLNLESPSRHIPWDRYRVAVPTQCHQWPGGEPRRAMVNSFGFNGSVASAVLEQAPPQPRLAAGTDDTAMFTLSARSHHSLRQQIDSYQRYLADHPDVCVSDLCYTSNVGRAHFAVRLAGPVRTREDLTGLLDRQATRREQANPAVEPRRQQIAFLFSGQGSQHPGMGRDLYQCYPVFREWLDECDHLFEPYLDRSIKEIALGLAEHSEWDIGQTGFTQPALFTLEYALARLWLSWGIRPDVLLGHSIGEITAAAVAGLFDLPDAVKLVAARAAAMQSVSVPGAMAAVAAAVSDVAGVLAEYEDVTVAAVNAPQQCVVSGGSASVAAVASALRQRGVRVRKLAVSHAFHSPLMAEARDTFRNAIADVRFHEPELTLVSNLTGEVATFSALATPDYWAHHLLEPVRFLDGMRCIARRGRHAFVEIGPAGTLTSLGKLCVDPAEHLWLTSLYPKRADSDVIRTSLARLYTAGLPVSWTGYHNGRRSRRIPLPGYAFDRRRYWLPISGRRRPETGGPGRDQAHPLLGREVSTAQQRSAGIREFASELRADAPAYLADHVFMNQVVFPGSGYLEILLAVQDAVFGETGRPVEDVRIHEPLFLDHDQPTELRTQVRTQPSGAATVEIVSRAGQIERRHATATVAVDPGPTSAARTTAELLIEQFDRLSQTPATSQANTLYADELYADFADRGLAYGPAFQRLRQVMRHGSDLAVGEVTCAQVPSGEHLPAVVLDAALQSIKAVAVDDSGAAFLPVRFDCFELFKKPRDDLRSLLRLVTPDTDEIDLAADVLLLEGDRPVALLRGLGLRRVAQPAGGDRHLFHQPRWVKRALPQPGPEASRARHALVANRTLADLASFGERLPDGARLSFAADTADVERLLGQETGLTDLWWFWTRYDGLQAECERNYENLLALLGVLEHHRSDHPVRLWLISQGGQWLPGDTPADATVDSLAASTLWGFGQTLLNEYPRHRVTMLDLPPTGEARIDYRPLLAEWLTSELSSSEFQIAYRDSLRHVKRIYPLDADAAPDADFELAIKTFGELSGVRQVPAGVAAPQGDQIQVLVHAAGLNFRDVLNALGLLRQHAEQTGVPYRPLPLGFEAAGTVVAAGPDAEFEVGEHVMLNHLGCMRSRVTVPSIAAVLKPPNIGFEEAAALPVAYVTAYHALHRLAEIKAGDRVLIHAAAGGVGQAALQLARRAGARVYATASPHKWAGLRSQGVEHVMNSRTLEFADEILRVTGGEGVDIILNSLSGDYVPAGLRCLSRGGRFVELGKIGIWSAEQVRAERPDVAYHCFDLSELPEDEHRRLARQAMQEVADLLISGDLSAIPTTAYTLDEVEEAFSVLARGANVGKLVLSFVDEAVPAAHPLQITADETYLITGGLSEIGMKVARELVARGARHLALVSRRAVTEEDLARVRSRLDGAQVDVYSGDIADPADIERMVDALKQRPHPLGGVIHAAGVLADAPVAKQTWDSIDTVLRPKAYGARLLHLLTERLPELRFFVVYSSIAAVLGPVAQANYAAANAYLDVLMQWRAAQGLPGLSINWGPWAEAGMAANLDTHQIRRVEHQGIRFLNPTEATRAMVLALGRPWDQVMICKFDWPRYTARQPITSGLYRQVATDPAAAGPAIDLTELRSKPLAEREAAIIDLLRARLADVLRFDSADDIEPDAKLTELGLDSLVAVELRNSLEAVLQVSLPVSMTFDYPSVPQVAHFLARQLEPTTAQAEPAGDDMAGVREPAEADAELTALRGVG